MLTEAQRVANTREHLSWAYRFALFWLVFSLVIFGAAYALAALEELSDTSRTLMFVMLGTIIVTTAVWQAAGFALARLENFIIPRVRS
jgi:membrane-anchored protein YejM (alkaline phosphatase superfamily)